MSTRASIKGRWLAALSLSTLILSTVSGLTSATAYAAVPANDDIVNAIDISGPLPISVAGDSTEATPQDPTDPVEGCAGIQHQYTVWYTYTPATSGTLAFTISSDYSATM